MPNYTSDGFTQDGGSVPGMVFGQPDESSDGSPMDYYTWDWKQIQASIVGLASGTANASDWTHAHAVADPQSLQDASAVFHEVQVVLEGVSKALADQADALAGEHGPWQGDAAQSFHNMMTNFSKQVQANADVLSGGSTGTHSVPKQLLVNAIELNYSQVAINELNTKYAAMALKLNAPQGSDGAVSVSQFPAIVNAMTEAMRHVLLNLANAYQFTTNGIVSPKTLDITVNSGDDPGGGGGLDNGLGGDPGAGGDIPGLGGDAGLGGDGGLGPDPQSLASLAGMPDPGTDPGLGGLDTGGGAGLDGLDNLAANPGPGIDPSDLAGVADGSIPGLGDGAGFGGAGFDPSALDNLLGTAPFSGLSGLRAGRGGALGDEALNGLAAEKPSAFGDTGLGDGLAGGIGDGLGEGLGDGLGAAEGAAQGVNSGGYPYMPGMGGGAGANALTSEPSDASGLLDPSTEPWEGDTALGDDEVGSETGAAAGGEGLGTAAAAEGLGAAGLPYLPGVGGMGGAPGGRDAAGERSDASGLLEPDTEPWEPEEAREEEQVGSPDGVLPGVPYLLGFGAPASPSHATGQGTTEGGVPAEAATAGPAATAEDGDRDASTNGAPAMTGSDGIPLPGSDSSGVVSRPLPDDGEEDFSAWEAATSAGAFVPLLWTLPRRGEAQSGTDEDGLAHEPRSTWQPERPVAANPSETSAVTPFVGLDDEPETDAEQDEEQSEEEPAEETSRGIADLLVQEESAWGTVPIGPNPLL
ncbi:hypothetical protein ABT215_39940 [Streptomyces sp900105755]|uniref:hypothetical protein n=1 Tax=Streptomyces sp. 900105755 TaxID=3154389 RepID=UPI00331E49F7